MIKHRHDTHQLLWTEFDEVVSQPLEALHTLFRYKVVCHDMPATVKGIVADLVQHAKRAQILPAFECETMKQYRRHLVRFEQFLTVYATYPFIKALSIEMADRMAAFKAMLALYMEDD